jgi:hypothetical protein
MRMRKSVLQIVVPAAAAVALLLVLIALGRAARDRLRGEDRYFLALADIDCPSPPGLERGEFLGEVQYLSHLPDRLPTLDDDLPSLLTAAFALHPWVEKVDRAVVTPGRVRVQLTFRTPTLVVPQPDGPRVVDGRGVLLPSGASTTGLLVLRGKVPALTGVAGQTWDDPSVTAAAAVADLLRSHQEGFILTEIESGEGGWVLRGNSVRVLWGAKPGSEGPEEARASEKVQRLLEYCRIHGKLDRPQPSLHDVRPQAASLSEPLR